MSFKILLPQPILESGRQYLLDKGYELVDGSGFEEEDIIRDIKGCDGMIVRTAKITRRILEAADSLKVIARHGAGFDGVWETENLFESCHEQADYKNHGQWYDGCFHE